MAISSFVFPLNFKLNSNTLDITYSSYYLVSFSKVITRLSGIKNKYAPFTTPSLLRYKKE